MIEREIRHMHFFCGLGGGARGFNRAKAELPAMRGRFRCLGGIDNDVPAIRDFERLAGVRGTALDLFSLEQYRAFHGCMPEPGWLEATRTDIHRAAGNERPHILFLSAPCKGFSGLLSESLSKSLRYQALNELALRGLHLALDAWGDDPAEFILFENVPRIATRGRHLLDQIEQLLAHYGYASAETTHDCGELGGLAQSRKRFLLVARHTEKVPPFLYEPVKRPLRAVGDVLGRMTLPGDPISGPMHRMPSLQWKTWVRLAFVEAGADWRSLAKLCVEEGYLKDFAIAPEAGYHGGIYGVNRWEKPVGTVTGRSTPATGSFAVADPRFTQSTQWNHGQAYGVRAWDEASGTVTGQRSPGQGAFSVADPRMSDGPAGPHFANVYRVVRWSDVARAITTGQGPSSGGQAIADPRVGYGANSHRNKLAMVGWQQPARTVTGGTQVQGGALSVADPRPGLNRKAGDHYATAGHYGVVRWDRAAGAVTASISHDNGPGNVADPRLQERHGTAGDAGLPAPNERLIAVIHALDDTWHRPFTTLELAALQGLIDPEEQLELDGLSDSAWRERIGNAVPSPAAEAIAGVIGTTLLLAWSGETFVLGATPIWVRPIAVALAAAQCKTEAA